MNRSSSGDPRVAATPRTSALPRAVLLVRALLVRALLVLVMLVLPAPLLPAPPVRPSLLTDEGGSGASMSPVLSAGGARGAPVTPMEAVPAASRPGVPDPGTLGPGAAARSGPGRDGTEQARWIWPTGVAVVLRPWEEPTDEYGPGHRGIDVPGAVGADVFAVEAGVVAFAGPVGGRGVVTIDHGGGLVSTLDSVTPSVHQGDRVRQGEVVGYVAVGHCTAEESCLHLGARQDDRYVDPTPFLSAAQWPVLLPWP